jgi:hypothetical protein
VGGLESERKLPRAGRVMLDFRLQGEALIGSASQGKCDFPARLVMENAPAFRETAFPNYRSVADLRLLFCDVDPL